VICLTLAVGSRAASYNACFFCLGSRPPEEVRLSTARLTYDLTLGWAKVPARSIGDDVHLRIGRRHRRRVDVGTSQGRLRARCSVFSLIHICFRLPALRPMHGEVSKNALDAESASRFHHALPLVRAIAPERCNN